MTVRGGITFQPSVHTISAALALSREAAAVAVVAASVCPRVSSVFMRSPSSAVRYLLYDQESILYDVFCVDILHTIPTPATLLVIDP